MEAFMKKMKLLTVGLVILVALGMGFISCGDEEDDDPSVFEGTWRNESETETIILSGSNFTFYGDEISCKGTFTYTEPEANAGTITLKFSDFSKDGIKWYKRVDFIDLMARESIGKTEVEWGNMQEAARQAERNKVRGVPNNETGDYSLSDNNNTLTLTTDSFSGTYFRDAGPAPATGTLRVYNRNETPPGNYIATIDVLKADETTQTTENCGTTIVKDMYFDIELPKGTYGLKVKRGGTTTTTWTYQSSVTIIGGVTTTINFHVALDEWE
jgi:hypothetical protein